MINRTVKRMYYLGWLVNIIWGQQIFFWKGLDSKYMRATNNLCCLFFFFFPFWRGLFIYFLQYFENVKLFLAHMTKEVMGSIWPGTLVSLTSIARKQTNLGNKLNFWKAVWWVNDQNKGGSNSVRQSIYFQGLLWQGTILVLEPQ